MIINQLKDKDGSGEIIFNDDEIKIINDNKKILLSPEALKHCTNLFVSLAIECNKNFSKENAQLTSHMGQDIETKGNL
tara:strand:- start:208 stop:441 length:234 start_codon:yes stop_codon:yes gene_type:complete